MSHLPAVSGSSRSAGEAQETPRAPAYLLMRAASIVSEEFCARPPVFEETEWVPGIRLSVYVRVSEAVFAV